MQVRWHSGNSYRGHEAVTTEREAIAGKVTEVLQGADLTVQEALDGEVPHLVVSRAS